MRISTWLAACALACAAAANAQTSQNAEDPSRPAPQPAAPAGVDPTHETSSTLNNSANRATDPTHGATQRFEAVPGGKATPRKDWKKGDPRGKPQKPRVSRKHVQEKLRKQHAKEAQR